MEFESLMSPALAGRFFTTSATEKMNKPVVELAVQGYSQPIGIATYRALRNIPEPYKTLAPVIDGVRRVLVEHGKEKRKSRRRKAK